MNRLILMDVKGLTESKTDDLLEGVEGNELNDEKEARIAEEYRNEITECPQNVPKLFS